MVLLKFPRILRTKIEFLKHYVNQKCLFRGLHARLTESIYIQACIKQAANGKQSKVIVLDMYLLDKI